ncbi:IS3 family transposase [Peribacillus loiseleuriae]|nr:IS3 family transposase [Peribacillus loiseleuriae]
MPRSTYDQSLIKTESARDRENRLLLEQIPLIHIESKGRYGAIKIHFLLSILKKEEVHHMTYLHFESANAALFQFIEGWYNRRRIHS